MWGCWKCCDGRYGTDNIYVYVYVYVAACVCAWGQCNDTCSFQTAVPMSRLAVLTVVSLVSEADCVLTMQPDRVWRGGTNGAVRVGSACGTSCAVYVFCNGLCG